jgi:hypothetical protein
MKKRLSFLLLCLFISKAVNALTYYVYDNEGNQWFMNRPNERTGIYPDSLSTVNKSKPHPDGIALRVETSLEKSKCMATAIAVCDETHGGIKLFVNGEPPKRCDMLTVKSMQTENGTYATSLVPYDGFKVDSFGDQYCPF